MSVIAKHAGSQSTKGRITIAIPRVSSGILDAVTKMAISAHEMLAYWKERLGLHSWDIRVKTEPAGERCGDAEGFIRPQIERADLTIFSGGEDQLELNLLHELVHVRLWAIDPYDADGVLNQCREVAVEWIARALYAGSPFAGKGEE